MQNLPCGTFVGNQCVDGVCSQCGGKKLIYTHVKLPLTAIADFAILGETDVRFKILDTLVKEGGGLWNARAERYLLENFG